MVDIVPSEIEIFPLFSIIDFSLILLIVRSPKLNLTFCFSSTVNCPLVFCNKVTIVSSLFFGTASSAACNVL